MTNQAPHANDLTIVDLHHNYRDGTTALAGIDLHLPANAIVGLLGRNGAGKTTLLSCVAGHRKPTAGQVLIGTTPVWETARMRDVFLITEGGGNSDTQRLQRKVEFLELLRPNFDRAWAMDLFELFGISPDTKVRNLSKGQRAAAGVSLALASRCPITLLDEAHLGMDAQNRYALYDHILADMADNPRTFVLSTHHVDEVTRLLDHVVIIDQGRVLRHANVDDLVGQAARLVGPTSRISEATAGLTILEDRTAGPSRSVTVTDADVPALTRQGRANGFSVDPVGLQDLFVALTGAIPHATHKA